MRRRNAALPEPPSPAPLPAVRCPRGSAAWASPAALPPLSSPYSRESSPFRPPPRLIGPRPYPAAPLVQQQAARAYFPSFKPHLTFSPPRESAPAQSLHSESSAGCCAQSRGFDWRWLGDCFRDWKQDCREGQAVASKSGGTTAKTTGASKESLAPFSCSSAVSKAALYSVSQLTWPMLRAHNVSEIVIGPYMGGYLILAFPQT